MPGHGPRLDAALETVADDQVVTGAEAVDEGVNAAEVIGVVGVAHDDEAALGGGDTGADSGTVAARLGNDDAGPGGLSQFLRAVRATVVGDDDLPGHAEPP